MPEGVPEKPLRPRRARRLNHDNPAPLWGLSVHHLWSGNGPKTRAPNGMGVFRERDANQDANLDADSATVERRKKSGRRLPEKASESLLNRDGMEHREEP